MRTVRTILITILACSLLATPFTFSPFPDVVSTAYATPQSEAQQAQKEAEAARKKEAEARAGADQAKGDVKALQSQIDEAEAKIAALKPQVDSAVGTATALREKEAKIASELEVKQKAVDKATDDFEESQKQLFSRMDSMYRQDSNFLLDLILSSESVSDLIQKTTYAERIIEENNRATNEFEAARDRLEEAKADLDKAYADAQKNRAEAEVAEKQVLTLQSTYKETEATAESKMKEKNALVAKLEGDASSYARIAAEQEAEAARIWQSISGDASTGTGKYTGTLAWPVPSSHRITSPFGDTAGRSKPHNAIDIGAPSGSTVVAAGNGVVLQAKYGWNGGYGNLIWIDHGNGLVTCYNHLLNSSFRVYQGQAVTAGQPIASVGSTGSSTGPHLDFQVMANRVYKNPINYF